jgi:hypothetical protein
VEVPNIIARRNDPTSNAKGKGREIVPEARDGGDSMDVDQLAQNGADQLDSEDDPVRLPILFDAVHAWI